MATPTKLRSRKVDFIKPVECIYEGEVPELDKDYIESSFCLLEAKGVEKEEESEHHLQLALSASHTPKKRRYIPIPPITTDSAFLNTLYTPNYKQSKIKYRHSVHGTETKTGLGATGSVPEYAYCIDEKDLKWLKDQGINTEVFENLISLIDYRLGGLGKQKIVDEVLAHGFARGLPIATLRKIIQYRNDKCRYMNTHQLCHAIVDDATRPNDPYAAFRKREIKLQGRKTRSTGVQTAQKVNLLVAELVSLKSLFEKMLARDKIKKEIFMQDQALFAKADDIAWACMRDDAATDFAMKVFKQFVHPYVIEPVRKGEAAKKMYDDITITADMLARRSNSLNTIEMMKRLEKQHDVHTAWDATFNEDYGEGILEDADYEPELVLDYTPCPMQPAALKKHYFAIGMQARHKGKYLDDFVKILGSNGFYN